MKRALVTGGNSPIGTAICLELASMEFHVIVHGHQHQEMSDEVTRQLVETGGSAESICCDLTDRETTEHTMGALIEKGPIQVIIHNAGVYDDAPMAGMTPQQWHRVIDVSLHGFFHVTQPLLLPMIRTRWGRIIAISSLSGMIGHRGQTNYSAAKAGLHGVARSLATEVASRGITVNVVAPGLIHSVHREDIYGRTN